MLLLFTIAYLDKYGIIYVFSKVSIKDIQPTVVPSLRLLAKITLSVVVRHTKEIYYYLCTHEMDYCQDHPTAGATAAYPIF